MKLDKFRHKNLIFIEQIYWRFLIFPFDNFVQNYFFLISNAIQWRFVNFAENRESESKYVHLLYIKTLQSCSFTINFNKLNKLLKIKLK